MLLLLLPEEEKDEKDFLKSITKISGPFSHQLDTIISGQQAKTGHINMTQIELRCCAAIINITQCKKRKSLASPTGGGKDVIIFFSFCVLWPRDSYVTKGSSRHQLYCTIRSSPQSQQFLRFQHLRKKSPSFFSYKLLIEMNSLCIQEVSEGKLSSMAFSHKEF